MPYNRSAKAQKRKALHTSRKAHAFSLVAL